MVAVNFSSFMSVLLHCQAEIMVIANAIEDTTLHSCYLFQTGGKEIKIWCMLQYLSIQIK